MEEKEELITNIEKVLDLVHAEKSNSGVVECPVCGKVLAYRKAENGHVFAKCETIGCLSFRM